MRTTLAAASSDINKLPADGLSSDARASLAAKVDAASRQFRLGYPCRALRQVGSARRLLATAEFTEYFDRATHVRIDTDLLQARVDLLTRADTARCGGGARTGGAREQVRVLSSSPTELRLHVDLPRPRMSTHTYRGHTYPDITMGKLGTAEQPGMPNVPLLAPMFAVPNGAQASVSIGATHSLLLPAVQLFPTQSQSADLGLQLVETPFSLPLFVRDEEAYASTTPFPSQLAAISTHGAMRDLNVGSLDLAAAQYTGASRELRVMTSYDVTIHFKGGTGRFADERMASPWNDGFTSIYRSTLVNAKTALANPGIVGGFSFCGEEVLVITPTALLDAANTLATARSAAGFWVRVVQTGAGPGRAGTTNTQIQSFIRSHVNAKSCLARPSYVILIGNTVHLPTFTPVTPWASTGFDGMIASDHPYALADDSDLLADVAVGRIPAPDLATANTVVNKIVAYENTPPWSPSFYSSAMNASYFQAYADDGDWSGAPSTQDTRTFIRTSETVRNALIASGKSVDRIYTTEASVPVPDPQRYDDGTWLPMSLRRPTFAWDGDAADITAGWNAGRFMVFHRDHGWTGGWGDPEFGNGDIAGLTNGGKLPVVFSVNCASALFDNPANVSFVERLLQKPGGGAVGAIGDSRNSPSLSNSRLALGMFDAIFPSVLPAYGSATPITRMGDVMVAGKAYLNSVEGAASSTNRAEQYLYHWFGDPTMQIWRTNPNRWWLNELSVQVLQRKIVVITPQRGTDGALVTLRDMHGQPIGRGRMAGGRADVLVEAPRLGVADVASVALERRGFTPGLVNLAGGKVELAPTTVG